MYGQSGRFLKVIQLEIPSPLRVAIATASPPPLTSHAHFSFSSLPSSPTRCSTASFLPSPSNPLVLDFSAALHWRFPRSLVGYGA